MKEEKKLNIAIMNGMMVNVERKEEENKLNVRKKGT